MDLRDQLRKAERKVWLAAERQINQARKEWADAERRLRRKMRIYPDEFVCSDTSGTEDQELRNGDVRLPVGGRAAQELHDPEAQAVRKTLVRKTIVSIHGRDVIDGADDEECGHLIQSR
jgi:hypothetical protein